MKAPGAFAGHAAVFGSPTLIGTRDYGFWEQVDPGAFRRALAERQDVRFLRDHDPSLLLGRSKAKTLRLSTDRRGLRVDATLPGTTLGRDVAVLLGRGDLDQMSFAFTVRPGGDRWEPGPDGLELRTLLDVDLWDVSVVTFPAYEDTDAALVTADQARAALRQRALRTRTRLLSDDLRRSDPAFDDWLVRRQAADTRRALAAHRQRRRRCA